MGFRRSIHFFGKSLMIIFFFETELFTLQLYGLDEFPQTFSKLGLQDDLWSFPTENWNSNRNKHRESPPPNALCIRQSALRPETAAYNDIHIDAQIAERITGLNYETKFLKDAIKAWNFTVAASNPKQNKEDIFDTVDRCINLIVDGCPTSPTSRADTIFAFACFLGAYMLILEVSVCPGYYPCYPSSEAYVSPRHWQKISAASPKLRYRLPSEHIAAHSRSSQSTQGQSESWESFWKLRSSSYFLTCQKKEIGEKMEAARGKLQIIELD